MSEATSQTLLRAYELIESDEHEQARELLEPVLATDPDNADAWWLYAHAVSTPSKAQEALSNLMRIAPNYPGADELNEKVRNQLAERRAEPEAQRGGQKSTAVREETNATLGRVIRWVALVGAVVAVLIVAFLLLSDTDDDDEGEEQPTSAVVAVPTIAIVTLAEDETAEAQIITTEEAQTGAGIVNETVSEGVLSAFSTFELAEEPTIMIDDAAAGRTLLVGVCANDAPLDLVDQAMQAVASVSTQVDAVDAMGVRIVDCTSGDVINSLAVDLDVAQQYNDQTIDLRGYQSQWRVLG